MGNRIEFESETVSSFANDSEGKTIELGNQAGFRGNGGYLYSAIR